jgi:hypothetical protein
MYYHLHLCTYLHDESVTLKGSLNHVSVHVQSEISPNCILKFSQTCCLHICVLAPKLVFKIPPEGNVTHGQVIYGSFLRCTRYFLVFYYDTVILTKILTLIENITPILTLNQVLAQNQP